MHEWVPLGLMIAFGLSVASWLWRVSQLYRSLEQRHPRMYEQIGRPTMHPTDPNRSGRWLLRFLARKEYAALDDPALDRLCRYLWINLWSCTVLFILVLVSPVFFL
jgi:hypothetical protein